MRLILVGLIVTIFGPDLRADDTDDFLKKDNWEGLANLWKLDGKTILGETTVDPKFNTFFCSKKKYTDFELSFKVQLFDGVGNSGVQVRSKISDAEADKGKFVVAGPQCDMGQQYWGSLYGEKFGGMMKASDADKVKKVVKPKEFNEYGIVVKGKHVTIKINGETMVDEDFEKLPDDGIIAFQIHSGFPKMRVEFKEIAFKNNGK